VFGTLPFFCGLWKGFVNILGAQFGFCQTKRRKCFPRNRTMAEIALLPSLRWRCNWPGFAALGLSLGQISVHRSHRSCSMGSERLVLKLLPGGLARCESFRRSCVGRRQGMVILESCAGGVYPRIRIRSTTRGLER
jgi:hypothetical protein